VAIDLTVADLSSWEWPERKFDLVVAIFIQFAPPALRTELFAGMVSVQRVLVSVKADCAQPRAGLMP
jgi:hypothetical protein